MRETRQEVVFLGIALEFLALSEYCILLFVPDLKIVPETILVELRCSLLSIAVVVSRD